MTEPGDEEARLMYAFAHDLRSHLRTMKTRVELVQKTAGNQLAELENLWLKEAIAAGEEMGRLIGQMVTYYAVAPEPEPMRLALLLRGLPIDLKKMLAEAGAELSIAETEAAIAVSRSLSVVLRELVANSCRFRKPGVTAEIRIACRMADANQVEVVVDDNGPGVEPEYLEAIFEPFRRMHSRSEYPGFGLGLALCRRIVNSNGGTIEAAVPSNGGLSIRMRLPALDADHS